jgi:cytochrome b6-f complex iron-sulfur subunit
MSNRSGKKNRRKILNLLLLGWTVVTAIPFISTVLRYISPPRRTGPVTAPVAAVADVPPNTGRIVSLGNRPVLLITTPDGRHRAFRANCTHLGCVVRFREDEGDIYCACHHSVFDIDGNNVSGPAARPLPELPIVIDNNRIIVTIS